MANSITLACRVTRDAELRYSPSGTAVLSFSVADNYFQNSKQEVQFFNCKMFGERAERIAQYVLKGMPITIFGTVRLNRYTDRAGVEKTGIEILVNDAVLQGSGSNNANDVPQDAPTPPTSQREASDDAQKKKSKSTQPAKPVDDMDDNIPF